MDLKDFKAGSFGKGYQYQYFLPEKINHLFYWTDPGINDLLEKASLKLGELNSFSKLVPDTDMFIKMHIFKEAVVSSRIEGTQTNIEEAIIDEKDINPEKRDDWQEVNNYVKAMNKAIEELKTLDVPQIVHPEHFWLLQQTADEVLDYRQAVEKYQHARQTVEEGGDHSFVSFERYPQQIIQFLNL